MHRTAGPDHDGSNLYKETNPATVINAHALNAVQEEIARAVVESGQTLAANGAADQTAGWVQLREAIRRLPYMQQDDATFTLVNAGTNNLTPALGETFIRLERSGAFNINVLLPNNVSHLGRIIALRNSCDAGVIIRDRRGCLSYMMHHAIEFFHCFIDDDGVNYNWAPMSGIYSGIIDITTTFSNPATSFPLACPYRKHAGKIDLYIGAGSTDGDVGNIITFQLPTFLKGSNSTKFPVLLSDGTVTPIFSFPSFPSGGGDDGWLLIPGVISASHELPFQWVTYSAANANMV